MENLRHGCSGRKIFKQQQAGSKGSSCDVGRELSEGNSRAALVAPSSPRPCSTYLLLRYLCCVTVPDMFTQHSKIAIDGLSVPLMNMQPLFIRSESSGRWVKASLTPIARAFMLSCSPSSRWCKMGACQSVSRPTALDWIAQWWGYAHPTGDM